jgi:hypothetical protein
MQPSFCGYADGFTENSNILLIVLSVMNNDFDQIERVVQSSLKSGSRRRGLTEVEKLVIKSIVQSMTYQQASAKYLYTESSFQNAASRLFKDLSSVMGESINRRNFVDTIAKKQLVELDGNPVEKMKFERIQANLWVQGNKAKIVSVSYSAPQFLDVTEYLIKYSQHFDATFCLDVNIQLPVLEMLWKLCDVLQVPLPAPRHDKELILQLIKTALQKKSTLLLLRFDRSVKSMDSSLCSEYTDVLIALGKIDRSGCLLVLENDLVGTTAEFKLALSHQLRSKIDACNKITQSFRLISINDDQQIICDLLETYLR